MDTTGIFNQLNSIYPLSVSLKAHISSIIKVEHHPKKALLLKAGHVATRIYFVNNGFLRAFYYKDETPYTTWFMGKAEFVISVYSFF